MAPWIGTSLARMPRRRRGVVRRRRGISMSGWLRPTGLAVLCVVLGAAGTMAATSSRVDVLSDDAAGSAAESVDVGTVRPIARPAQQMPGKPIPRGNPLWSVPLSALSATQERPIFSSMRRPPPRAVAALPVEESPAATPKPVEAPPPLLLVGAVVGEGDAIAILVNRADQKVVRLRQGESLAGWSLTSVQPREVTFKQGERSEVLVLQRSDAAAPAGPPADAGGKLTMPGPADPSFSPFVPRSTPKNGESDGL
jgi:general secretion pathway protein N